MGVANVLAHKVIFSVANLTVLCNHFNATTACCITWLHDPQMLFGFVLANHLKSIEVTWKQVCGWHEVELFRMLPPHALQSLVHVVFSTKGPTAWEMVHLLEAVELPSVLEVGTVDVEHYIPG